jgi:hypothetical protein
MEMTLDLFLTYGSGLSHCFRPFVTTIMSFLSCFPNHTCSFHDYIFFLVSLRIIFLLSINASCLVNCCTYRHRSSVCSHRFSAYSHRPLVSFLDDTSNHPSSFVCLVIVAQVVIYLLYVVIGSLHVVFNL